MTTPTVRLRRRAPCACVRPHLLAAAHRQHLDRPLPPLQTMPSWGCPIPHPLTRSSAPTAAWQRWVGGGGERRRGGGARPQQRQSCGGSGAPEHSGFHEGIAGARLCWPRRRALRTRVMPTRHAHPHGRPSPPGSLPSPCRSTTPTCLRMSPPQTSKSSSTPCTRCELGGPAVHAVRRRRARGHPNSAAPAPAACIHAPACTHAPRLPQTLTDPDKRSAYDAIVGFEVGGINPFADTSYERDMVRGREHRAGRRAGPAVRLRGARRHITYLSPAPRTRPCPAWLHPCPGVCG